MTRFAKPLTWWAMACLLGSSARYVCAQQPEPGQQTIQTLKPMIENLGYQPKEFKNDKGEITRYLIAAVSGGRNWNISLEISPNQQNLWIYADLAPIADTNQVPREVLFDMLKANEKMGPSHFAFNEKIKMFVLYHPVSNRGITPKLVRERIELVARQVEDHERLWNPKLWSVAPEPRPVAISPDVQRLIGELGSSNELVRLKAAKDLAKLGSSGKAAIPALQKLLQDPDEDVRRVAASAIERIQGTPAPGPGPAPGPAPNTIAGTTWEGSETLGGFGKLKFQFEPDGKVIMYDAKWAERGTVGGSWTQTGNQLKIGFKDCVYEGTINGDTLSGAARFVESGQAWTFSLTRSASTTRAVLGSKAILGSKPEPAPAELGGRHQRR